jgi:hypothetical protein
MISVDYHIILIVITSHVYLAIKSKDHWNMLLFLRWGSCSGVGTLLDFSTAFHLVFHACNSADLIFMQTVVLKFFQFTFIKIC